MTFHPGRKATVLKRRALCMMVTIGLSALAPSVATAEPTPVPAPTPAPAEDPKVVEARAEYVRGNELAKSTQWAQALTAFERSSALRPHALTTYNMAVCERALGRFTRARELFGAAIAVESKEPGQLPPSRLEDSRGYIKELDDALVVLEVTLDPGDTAIALDGRPLTFAADAEGKGPHAVGGVAAPGAPEAPPRPAFRLLVDPGTHVFRLVARGHGDALVTKTYAPGEKAKLDIALARLPATLRITSNVLDPIVTVNGADVGAAPVVVSRPAGDYRIVVKKEGFETFDTKLGVSAGQDVDLPAKLSEERTPLTKRWWFWTAVGSALVGGAALTYALTRESPAPAPYNGGTTGWVITPR